MPVNFIAEIGQNHNGSLATAKQMVDSLLGSGVKIIKTAKRDVNSFPEEWKITPYENKNSFGKTYHEHRLALELTDKEFLELRDYVQFYGFQFMSSFTDLPSLKWLIKNSIMIKVPSSRATDHKCLKYIAKHYTGTVFISYGMSSHGDILKARGILKGCNGVELLCTSAYPAKKEDLNFSLIQTYGFKGVSGHWVGTTYDPFAYSMGAKFIERHYTLDKTWKGTDQALSITADEVKYIIDTTAEIDAFMGKGGKKQVLPSEQKTIYKLRYDLKP